MSTGFKVTQIGNYIVDLDDLLMRRRYFEDPLLWVWGSNTYGELGDNSTVQKSSPVTTFFTIYDTLIDLSSNGFVSSAIKTDGTLWTWGYNSEGRLGDNSNINKSSPVTVSGGGTNWKIVSCGSSVMSAIKTDGTLWTWGDNGNGQLGDNSTINKSSPVTIAGGGTTWSTVSSARGYVTSSNIAAIKTDGTLWVWGDNTYGQLGNNTTIKKSSPITVSGGGTTWQQVSTGDGHIAAIKTDGTLWVWGDNTYGQLGINSTIKKSSPVTISGGGTTWKQCSADPARLFAIKTDGTLWSCGDNGLGQLYDNTIISRSSPILVVGSTSWKEINASISFIALKTDGSVWIPYYNAAAELYYLSQAPVPYANVSLITCSLHYMVY